MEFIHILLLALIQGITEFLPISSSAHLLLPQKLLDWPDQGLAFDVAVHVGSLCAVVIYFRRDVYQLIAAWLVHVTKRQASDDSRLAWYVIWATIPAGLAGLIFHDFIELNLRSVAVVAWATIAFGLLLAWADWSGERQKTLLEMTLTMALVIGVAQALALIPGTSRSGITITAALFLGLQREDAARFSFLLSIPLILLSGGYKAFQLLGSEALIWQDMFWGALFSGLSAFACIHLFLSFINRIGMMPFVLYRLLLGAALVWMIV